MGKKWNPLLGKFELIKAEQDLSGYISFEDEAPATAGSTGTAGMVAYDSGYLYVCVDTDTWKRCELTTWE